MINCDNNFGSIEQAKTVASGAGELFLENAAENPIDLDLEGANNQIQLDRIRRRNYYFREWQFKVGTISDKYSTIVSRPESSNLTFTRRIFIERLELNYLRLDLTFSEIFV